MDEATAVRNNGQRSTHPRSACGGKSPSGELKEGGLIPPAEEEAGPEEAQASMPLIKEALAGMLSKIETLLKVDIAAVLADIEQVLGQVREMEERLDTHEQILEAISKQMKSL